MAALADTAQLALAWRPLSDAELPAMDYKLEQASRYIRRLWPSVDSWVADGLLSADDVADVVTSMVERAATRKAGVRSSTVQRGPFGETEAYANPNGGMYLTSDERALFNSVQVGRGTAFSIDTTPRC